MAVARALFSSAGVTPIRLPPSSPNLNAYAERFVRSIKRESLDKLALLGESHLRAAVRDTRLVLRGRRAIDERAFDASTFPTGNGLRVNWRAEMTDRASKNDSQLALAVSDGETSTAVKLLAAGADPNTRTEDGELVLAVACQEGDLVTVSALLDAGAEVDALDGLGEPPLATAASKGHIDVVARLIEAGADVHMQFGDEDGHTHLTRALDVNIVMEPSVGAIKALLDAGVDPNKTSNTGWSPLHYAACFEEPALVDVLVAGGASPKRASPKGVYAVELAERHGQSAARERLLAHGSPTVEEAAMLRMQASWARIRRWFSENAPAYEARMAEAKGASPEDIRALEAKLDASLPADFRAYLLLFGERDPGRSGRVKFYEYTSLSVAEIASHWEDLEKLRNEGAFADVTPHELDEDDSEVKWTWWHRGWIPFAQDGGGNLFCVDVDPGARGNRGQIIGWEAHGGPVGPRARDFDALLDRYYEQMTEEELEYVDETLYRK
jgi:cell wall assembly regulator SMI1